MTDSDELPRRLQAALGSGFAVERLLGSGGFASVFLVRDLTLKRALAVKVLSPDMITSKTVLERFRREAETIAQLQHPHIVPLYALGQQDEMVYLAMAFVDGGSLADRLARDPALSVAEVVRIMREVASALAHAHKRGVVHRDIKPGNVLIDAESGRCLVTDFGIARTAEGGSLTATGMMLGTPAYMAPEQVTGEPSDHRVDLFALGVMAYELLAGRLPFDAPTPSAALMRRLAGPPEPIATVRADVGPELSAVIDRCLASDPAARYASGEALVRDLEALGDAVPRNSATRAARVGALAVLGAIVMGGAIWWMMPARAPSAAATTPPPAGDSTLVAMPAGEYRIGNDADAASLAYPEHRVTVAPFLIERTEVTIGAYRAYVDATNANAPWTAAQRDSTSLPVTRVSWGDAANYCAWRYRPDGRLPTEFEWEAAARGPNARAYPWGSVAEPGRANVGSLRNGPVPVGSFPSGRTPEGVHDLIGNVWEWTSSPLGSYPGRRAPLPDSLARYRVIRGGAFDSPEGSATPWVRGYQLPSTPPAMLNRTGFRCARAVLAARGPAP